VIEPSIQIYIVVGWWWKNYVAALCISLKLTIGDKIRYLCIIHERDLRVSLISMPSGALESSVPMMLLGDLDEDTDSAGEARKSTCSDIFSCVNKLRFNIWNNGAFTGAYPVEDRAICHSLRG